MAHLCCHILHFEQKQKYNKKMDGVFFFSSTRKEKKALREEKNAKKGGAYFLVF
jgi:hypothetical protein